VNLYPCLWNNFGHFGTFIYNSNLGILKFDKLDVRKFGILGF